ncbi:hypothetical protein EKO04_008963 [Ascochyta lentis]|uniref:Peptidase M10 metallopeptidase domain-containing protein n=1 Tax=Ascochyta lentis TaxID=205686 RepID=A0A8H7IUI9_9PLEO|nr:hypothetical protein EKO04_008963 [Ascochyta lentis]
MSFEPPTTKEVLLDAVIQKAGEHVLSTVAPSENLDIPEAVYSFPGEFIPPCCTQAPIPIALRNGPSDIMLGLDKECPRWAPGSVIRWAAWRQGFKSDEDAVFAADHLSIAANKWNSLDVGVKFEWVPLAKDAVFVLCHGGSNGNTLAQAFFPNPNDLSYFLVFNAAFSIKSWKENMWKIFTHELGHVLGLRHEFSMDVNEQTGEVREKERAVQLGPRNENSVMTYGRRPPEIQQSDIDSTRAFYALTDDANGDPPRIGMTDVRDYTPM